MRKNRGGWEKAADEAILRLWHSLDVETRAAYLKSVEPEVSATPENAGEGTGTT